jgi:hypothetical protein
MAIPNGRQEATPVSWKLVGDDGKEQFEIEFQTAHGNIRWWGGFKSDRARKYSENQMKRCGWSGSWTDLELKREPVSIIVEEEEYNGSVSQKVKAVVGVGGGEELAPDKAKSFIARMAGATIEREPGDDGGFL